ncbi:MAG: DnaJ domain-containing protein [Gammaproteobacteria bacterium]
MKVFVDYYEVLEISPNANSETIDRIFRYLAQRYHPDNRQTGSHEKFSEIVQAHETLRQPEKRAQYDLDYKRHTENSVKLVHETDDIESLEHDASVRERVLSIMYIKRRRNMLNPGIGPLELERLTGCPREHLEFHLWYLKEKGWISRMENGLLSITVAGVDEAIQEHRRISTKLLTDQKRNDRQG